MSRWTTVTWLALLAGSGCVKERTLEALAEASAAQAGVDWKADGSLPVPCVPRRSPLSCESCAPVQAALVPERPNPVIKTGGPGTASPPRPGIISSDRIAIRRVEFRPHARDLELSSLSVCGGVLTSVAEKRHAIVSLGWFGVIGETHSFRAGQKGDAQVEGLACWRDGRSAAVVEYRDRTGTLYIFDEQGVPKKPVETAVRSHPLAQASGWEAVAWLTKDTLFVVGEHSDGVGAIYTVTPDAVKPGTSVTVPIEPDWRISDATATEDFLLVLEVSEHVAKGDNPALKIAIVPLKSGELDPKAWKMVTVELPYRGGTVDCMSAEGDIGKCINPEGIAVAGGKVVIVTDDKYEDERSATRWLELRFDELLTAAGLSSPVVSADSTGAQEPEQVENSSQPGPAGTEPMLDETANPGTKAKTTEP